MASRPTVLLEDDLDGGKADETVTFGLDGHAFEIDLSARNAANLRKTLAAYVNAARRVGRVSGSRATSPKQTTARRQESEAIRAWARKNGYKVSERGRIPALLRDAYSRREQTEFLRGWYAPERSSNR